MQTPSSLSPSPPITLSPNERDALAILALSTKPISRTQWQDHVRAVGLRADATRALSGEGFKAVVARLESSRLVVLTAPDYGAPGYVVPPRSSRRCSRIRAPAERSARSPGPESRATPTRTGTTSTSGCASESSCATPSSLEVASVVVHQVGGVAVKIRDQARFVRVDRQSRVGPEVRRSLRDDETGEQLEDLDRGP